MGKAAGVLVLMVVALAACGDDGTVSSSSSGETTTVAANQPMTVVVDASATEVSVGEDVVFRVTATDPDAAISGGCPTVHWFGDEQAYPASCGPACAGDVEYAEIPPTLGEVSETFTHAYDAPGTFEASFTYSSLRQCHQGFRYGSEATETATITVLPSAG